MTPAVSVEALAGLIFALWAFGAALLATLHFLPATRKQTKGLWPLLMSEAAILLAATLPWLLPREILLVILVAASLRWGYESGWVNGKSIQKDSGVWGAAMLGAVCLAGWLAGTQTPGVAAVLGILLLAVVLGLSRLAYLPWWRHMIAFPVLPVAAFSFLASNASAGFSFVLALIMVEVFDSFALLGGKLFGSHLMVPRISPRKTWEGFFIGLAATVIVSLMMAWVFQLPLLQIALFALVATVGALAGDLSASVAKRRAGVKDYPPVLAIQGGLLDIYDSWIVAAPLVFIAAWLSG